MRLGITMRIFIVDTLATLVFLTVAAALSEHFIAGMDWGQVLTSRTLAIPVLLATGRLYGMWRDFIFRRFQNDSFGKVSNVIIDISAFLTFKIPLYIAILFFAGANLNQIIAAVSSGLVLVVILARPFGIYLDACRRMCRVPPA